MGITTKIKTDRLARYGMGRSFDFAFFSLSSLPYFFSCNPSFYFFRFLFHTSLPLPPSSWKDGRAALAGCQVEITDGVYNDSVREK